MQNKRYTIPDQSTEQDLFAAVHREFPFKETVTPPRRQLFLDTFDWLLYNKGLACCRERRICRLINLSTGSTVEEIPWSTKRLPGFWQEFPDSHFKDLLKSHINVRRLLPRFRAETRSRCLHILNNDNKTVLRIFIEQAIAAGNKTEPLVRMATLVPVRGYHKFSQRGQQLIDSLDLSPAPTNLFHLAADAAGQAPGSYTSKLNVSLSPEMSAGQAVVIIFQNQLQVIRQNEDGIIRDIDSEFLHDFRVAVRRTRSCLVQVKNVFTTDTTRHFKTELATLGKMTNRLRDLDVYLLKEDLYLAMLPRVFQTHLGPLFTYLAEERKKEVKKTRRFLRGKGYKKILRDWEKFITDFSRSKIDAGSNVDVPVLSLAKKFIAKSFVKVQKQGQAITDITPNAEIHQLRISCKKLRYLLEFFTSLFPPEDIGRLVKQLKILQDNLGDFNDYCVQQAALHQYLEQHVPKKDGSIDTAAAIGALIANLNQQQIRVHQEFHQAFSQFNSHENVALFHQLFDHPKPQPDCTDGETT